MAQTISIHPHIEIRTSFFGLIKKIFYTPTQSLVDVFQGYYNAENGEKIKALLEIPTDKAEKKPLKKIDKISVGNVQLEACVSRDHQFVALQLSRYSDFTYHAVTPVTCYEGSDAEWISAIL